MAWDHSDLLPNSDIIQNGKKVHCILVYYGIPVLLVQKKVVKEDHLNVFVLLILKKIMKNLTQLFPVIACFTMTIFIFNSCSKERIEPERQAKNEYTSMDAFYDTHKQKEQEFVITSDSGGPIIGNQGTKIWVSKSIFMHPNTADVEYPFTIKLIELYKAKDMLLYNMPNISSANMLSSHGEIRVRAFHGTDELVLKPNATYRTEIPNSSPSADMKLFYGKSTGTTTDWVFPPSTISTSPNVDLLSVLTPSTGFYTADVSVMGWISPAYLYPISSKTKLSLTSTTDNLTNLSKYLYFKDIKSLVRIADTVSTDVPVGANVSVICAGISADNKIFSFTYNTTVASNHLVLVKMTETTDTDFLSYLDGL